MPTQAQDSLVKRIKSALCRDPKRTGVMGTLGVVMLILWGRMLLNGPASATATFIRRSVAAITDSSASQPKPTSTSAVLEWLGKPKQPVSRNLFTIHLDYYARAGVNTPSPESDGSIDAGPGGATDQKRQQQILQENLQAQAGN